jgi:hypothetical protein
MAVLNSQDEENIQVVTANPVSFGDLASGGHATGDPFQVIISEDCPVGQLIPVNLHVISNNQAWDYYYEIKVNGCELVVNSFMVNDAGVANPNYRMDPGETVMLFVAVKNTGNDIAPDVLGILSSDDPYITIEDSTGNYGSVNINGIGLNAPNYFLVTVDAACPADYLADYTLKLKTFNGNYPYQTYCSLSIPVSKPIPSDYTGPDEYGYYAYSSDDYFDQAPVYNWFEIDGSGTQLNIVGLGDYTETVNLPFTFTYYGIDYSQLRISTDGWIAFGSGTQTASVNESLPHIDAINCMAAGFWDDLYDSETVEGNIFYYNDVANHRFIVEWDSIARNDFGSEPAVEIFQAVLYDPDYFPTETGDGDIIFYYKQIETPQSSSIGIENQSQDIGLQYLFNNEYDPTASGLTNEFAIRFTTEPPFASIITSTDQEGQGLTGNGPVLQQNHPNPFNGSTRISYVLPEASQVSLTVYDVNGVLVSSLFNGKQLAGSHTIMWNGMNNAGIPASAGIYFYQLKTDRFNESRKMFLLR